jgi:hypothetical protein
MVSWIITLRRRENGLAVGAGDIVHTVDGGSRMEVDNWSANLELVYARPPGHKPPAPVREFSAEALGLYFGTPAEYVGLTKTPQPVPRRPFGVPGIGKPSVAPEAAETPEELGRAVIRATFVEALGDYIDARIDYRAADPEWKSGRDVAQAADRLETALADVLKHGAPHD